MRITAAILALTLVGVNAAAAQPAGVASWSVRPYGRELTAGLGFV